MACRQLGNMELSGQLPFSDNIWGQLPELETLDLSNNNVGGYLPPSIGTLKNLKIAKLSGNSLNGTRSRLSAACLTQLLSSLVHFGAICNLAWFVAACCC